jgi:hypothetical protein
MDETASFETDAMLMRAIPITPLGIKGRLRLKDGRLRFTRASGETLFDVRPSEISGLKTLGPVMLRMVCAGQKRTVAIGKQVVMSPVGPVGLAVTAAKMPGAISANRQNKDLVGQWLTLLKQSGASAG